VERAHFGDWEVDRVIGAAQKQALMRVNERVSGEPKIVRVAFETAHTIGEALITLRKPFAHCGHTRTTDKGKEFTPYERIALALSTDFFFAHLYVSWERGEKRKE
jgi:IS30 family transposase